jgi:hypothetical protein
LLLRGDFSRGWADYEWRLTTTRTFAQPQWDGGPLAGRTILLHAEQGLGDTLHFIRYAERVAAAGGNVVVECQAPLKRLLHDSLERIPVISHGEPLPSFDVHCPLLSLPRLFQTTLESIPARVPYVDANDALAPQWRARLADKDRHLKIGLVWAGSEAHQNDRNRSIPLATFAPLAQGPNTCIYSLQKGDAARQAAASSAPFPLVDWTSELHDFADTAALIAQLDLIITVDTAMAHLAGALGKPVWALVPHVPDWRWLLDRDDSPWYPTMRLFRQTNPGDWTSVLERVATALRISGLASVRRVSNPSSCA